MKRKIQNVSKALVGALLFAAAFVSVYARQVISEETSSVQAQEAWVRARLRSDETPMYQPRARKLAALHDKAGPFFTKRCELSRAELDALSDEAAEIQVSHAISLLRSTDTDLFAHAVLAQPARSTSELFVSSPRFVVPSANVSTLQNVESTINSLRICGLRRLKQFGEFASVAKEMVSSYVADPSVKSEALAALASLDPQGAGGST